MDLTAAHWIYLAGVVVIIAVMVARKNVVVPAVGATFLTAWVFTGSFVTGLSSVFNASLTAASELFSIFLIIALVTSLLGALRALGADTRMVRPFQGLMGNGTTAFVVLAVVTYLISLFFWPTPAVPLIGAILLPAAIRAGLPAMGAAMAIAIAGQGMALSSDYVIQVAPGLSAKAAGVPTGTVADRVLVLSLVTGLIALVLAYLQIRRTIVAPNAALLNRWESTAAEATLLVEQGSEEVEVSTVDVTATGGQVASARSGGDPLTTASGGSDAPQGVATISRHGESASGSGAHGANASTPANGASHGDGPGAGVPTSGRAGAPALSPAGGDTPVSTHAVKRSKLFAVLVPVAFAALVGYMLLGKFTSLVAPLEGGDAAALVGGTAALLLLLATITLDGRGSLESCATHVVDGLVFAFKAMGVVIPIAGFFFIGNSDFAGTIMGLGDGAKAPGFLFDLVSHAQHAIPNNPIVMSFGILVIGMATGLDGSGFSGLPLTGSLSGALGPGSSMDPATLAAIGQMGSIWAGGGVLIAWSSLLAVAGFARVPAVELARRCFVPVVVGLVVSTVVAVVLF